jgi:membrane fusion protein (multidrug efflux system)
MPITKSSLPLAAIAMAAISFSGCSESGNSAPQSAPPPMEVGVMTVHPQRVEITAELSGRTSPFQVAEVRPQVTGIIQKRLFKEGSEVKAGDLLYQVDAASYQAAFDSASAALARTQATLASAQSKSDRFQSLYSTKVVSQQDFEDVGLALRQAQADIDAGKAALETARINLEDTRITAPISGVIGRSSYTEGALVTTNQANALATVQQLDPMYIDVTESTADFLRLRMGVDRGAAPSGQGADAQVKLTLSNGAPYPQLGTLQFTDATVDESTGAVTLRTLFPNPDHLLLPGMYVRAEIVERVDDHGILVSQRGVGRDQKGQATALVVTADNKVEQRNITASRTVGDSWLVESGISDGDRVIVEGVQKVRPGQVVKTDEIAAASASAPQASAALAKPANP